MKKGEEGISLEFTLTTIVKNCSMHSTSLISTENSNPLELHSWQSTITWEETDATSDIFSWIAVINNEKSLLDEK